MENPLGIQSYNYRQMNRRIRQAIVSTQKLCEHRKDIPSSALIYKQYRQPIWRLNLYSINTDEHYKWPKSRKLVNILSDPNRSLYRNPFVDEGYSFALPISADHRTTPNLPLKCLRPLRSARFRVTPPCIHRHSPPRLVVPPAAYRRSQAYQPSTSRRDFSYLYDSRSGTISPDLDFKSRLLSRTSAYAYPFLTGETRNPRETTRLADRMFSTYANRSMELETSNLFKLHSKLAQHSSGYKYAQFSMTPRNEANTYKIPLIIKHDRFKPKGPIDVRQVVTRFGKKPRPLFPDLGLYPEFPREKYHRSDRKLYANDFEHYSEFTRTDRRNKIPFVIKHDRFKPKGPINVREVVLRFGKKPRPMFPDLGLYPEFPRAKYHRPDRHLYSNSYDFEHYSELNRTDDRNKIPLVIKHDRFKPKGPVDVRDVVLRFGKKPRPLFPDLGLYPEFPRAKYHRPDRVLGTDDYEFENYGEVTSDHRNTIPLVIKHDRFKPKGPVDVRDVVLRFGKKPRPLYPDLDLYPEFPRVKFNRPHVDDIGLRLRLSMKLSPSTMTQLYPNENLIMSSLPTTPSKDRLKKIFEDEALLLNNNTLGYHCKSGKALEAKTIHSESNKTSSSSRRIISNDYLYPSYLSTSSMRKLELRPLPGTNLQLKISRLADKLSSKFDEDTSDVDLPRLPTSSNNYSQLYVAHPEYLSSTELGDRIKLSLRSSTNKIASLYASHPVDSKRMPVPTRRKLARTSSTSSRIPDRYLPDSYVPRPGIISPLRVSPNLHGLA